MNAIESTDQSDKSIVGFDSIDFGAYAPSCYVEYDMDILTLKMTLKVTSGRTGSSIFRLAVVDIPIQCLTSVTLRRQISPTMGVKGEKSMFEQFAKNQVCVLRC